MTKFEEFMIKERYGTDDIEQYEPMTIFVVEDSPKNGIGDIYPSYFATRAEAEAEALKQWGQLTKNEQQKRTIICGDLANDNGDMHTIFAKYE